MPETNPEEKLIYWCFTASHGALGVFNLTVYAMVNLHCLCFYFQETEAAVKAKQPNVEEVLSKGCHLYKEKPATHPVKVMKQPLAISITV